VATLCCSCKYHTNDMNAGTAWHHRVFVYAAISYAAIPYRATFDPNVGFFEKMNHGSDSIMRRECAYGKGSQCSPKDVTHSCCCGGLLQSEVWICSLI
jgi:hypothetical protein